jgi:hypothetical protein
VNELASFLELDVPDALALLESMHFVRQPAAIQLSEAERTTIYANLRQRRESGTRDLLDRHLIRREVFSSNRIEGISSRRWPTQEE